MAKRRRTRAVCWACRAGLIIVLGLAGDTFAAGPMLALGIENRDGVIHHFSVEVADTEARRKLGLMFRDVLPADGGMLFDFGEARPVSMWMKNTFMALDVVFIAGNGAIVRIAHSAAPLSSEHIYSGAPVRAVLELAGGVTDRLAIRPGDRVVCALFAAAPGPATVNVRMDLGAATSGPR